MEDSREIRATALRNKVPYYTTAAGCHATARAIRSESKHSFEVISIQELKNFTKNQETKHQDN